MLCCIKFVMLGTCAYSSRMDIASRIDRAMRAAGIKHQADLARRSGLPESTIARVLKIGGNPSVDTVAALAKTLKVSMDWIVNGKESNNDDVPDILVYASVLELRVITLLREATPEGRQLILNAAEAASKRPRDDEKPTSSD